MKKADIVQRYGMGNLQSGARLSVIIVVVVILAGIFTSGCVQSTRGPVSFSSEPPGAEIWIDGVDTGKTTPYIFRGIDPGNHTYALKMDGYTVLSGIFNAEAGKTIDLSIIIPVQEASIYELKYDLLENVGTFFYCDPDFYPVAREGIEMQNALLQFPDIQENSQEFQAILNHTNLQSVNGFSDEQKLVIYREHKKLNAILLSPSGDGYEFRLSISEANGSIFELEGMIYPNRSKQILKEEPGFPCPICLAGDTLIDTPGGKIAVKDIQAGTAVWTADASGSRIPAVVLKTASVPVPPGHQMAHLVLDDGRELLASPGHPIADGRSLGSLEAGDIVDGANVLRLELVSGNFPVTYDILPSGDTGVYWAGGIGVKTTLERDG